MLTCVNVKKHYFSNTVHYCRSSMPLLVFYKAPPSKHSLLWLASWHSALWLAEHHKPCRKCNTPFHNRELQFFKTKLKTVNNVLSFTISSSPRGEQSRVTDSDEALMCLHTSCGCDVTFTPSHTHTILQLTNSLSQTHTHNSAAD